MGSNPKAEEKARRAAEVEQVQQRDFAAVRAGEAIVVPIRLAFDFLHDGVGALADERDRHRVGAHAVARDAAGGAGDRRTVVDQ
jgi:hypothetical protein